MKMKKTLMTTVAAAAVVGFAAIAAAQSAIRRRRSKTGRRPGRAERRSRRGRRCHDASAGRREVDWEDDESVGRKAGNPSAGKAAQGAEPNAKPDQKMGQSQKNEPTPQRGAQDEQTTTQKGAQTENATPQKGAQEESGKSGTRGASVQLSQDQRSRVGAVIGKSSSARMTTNVNFNISVGTRVPRDVHFAVLPADVVEIVPQYEGYDYVVVGEQILIIDPTDMEIVAIIET